MVENGRAAAIETADGEFIRARHGVASSLNPQQTFLDLLDEAHVPAPLRAQAAAFKYNLIAPLFALNLNLREPPRYKVAAQRPELDRGFMVVMGLDHVDQFSDVIRHHEAGTMPPTIMWGACPTRFDPTQAPPGRHTAFMWEKAPYRLNGDARNWDGARDAHGRDMLGLWRQHAPNLADAVIDSFTRSPLDVERSLPNMREGDLLDRRLYRRPDRLQPAVPRRRAVSRPFAGPLPVRIEQPSGRQYHRLARLQRRAGRSRRAWHQGRLGAAATRRAVGPIMNAAID